MNARLVGAVMALTAPFAMAQVHEAVPVGPSSTPFPAVVPSRPGCATPPAISRPVPVGLRGRWELQRVQHWVPGATQSVWVEGVCRPHRRHPWKQRCEPGRYVTVQQPGYSESRQEWVWVSYGGGLHHPFSARRINFR